MKNLFKASLLAASVLTLNPLHAAPLSDAEMRTAKAQIEARYRADQAACGAMLSNAKDVCHEEAKGKEKVAQAELNHRHSGSPRDANRLATVRAETAYEVAKERCDDWSGNAKDVCVKEAKAQETKALADIKLGKEIGQARKDAIEEKREANYKVAAEKCDAMAGDSKTQCVSAAKTAHGMH